jgi:hypothetical protein
LLAAQLGAKDTAIVAVGQTASAVVPLKAYIIDLEFH